MLPSEIPNQRTQGVNRFDAKQPLLQPNAYQVQTRFQAMAYQRGLSRYLTCPPNWSWMDLPVSSSRWA